MNHKVNLQARIKRHSRILKDNLGGSLHQSAKKSMTSRVIAAVIILAFPIYPAFASFMYTNTQLDFYRGDIDEGSILSSYDEAPVMMDADTLFEAKDSYLSVGALVEDDLSSSNKMITYDVKDGDTIELIAKKYDVSYDTIMWENNFGTGHLVKNGDKVTFPPVTGVTYKVKRGDTVSTIAKKYSIDGEQIAKQNLLVDNKINPGKKIILPGAKYIAPPKIVKPKVQYVNKKVYSQTQKKYVTQKVALPKTTAAQKNYTSSGMYPLKWRKPYSGAYGNCTYYVASYKNVNWRGNANQW
ncbi:LysM peptidoglycan-binding domain-containing protein, partial [Candidatus Gracilibacteria bacterium]|nr:LysM peptidoglycan-binding domain-containing protein [Candidatus Gracilibacteria bacterium]